MKIAVAYVFPLVNLRIYYPLAQRFAKTYVQFPAGIEHELHVIHNGSLATDLEKRVFDGIPHTLHTRDNFGWDIGAYQYAALRLECDLLVCLGAPVHFYRPGWLERMTDTYVLEGPGYFGCWGFRFPFHIRTTAFWLPPALLNSYPDLVGTARRSRYQFEHGPNSLARHTLQLGFEATVVSWKETWPHDRWDQAKTGIGDCLCLDQHTHR